MKPSISFIVEFYFGDNSQSMPFASSQNFDHAYMQQQCDKVYAEIQYSIGKTKQYWNKKDKESLARKVKAIYQ